MTNTVFRKNSCEYLFQEPLPCGEGEAEPVSVFRVAAPQPGQAAHLEHTGWGTAKPWACQDSLCSARAPSPERSLQTDSGSAFGDGTCRAHVRAAEGTGLSLRREECFGVTAVSNFIFSLTLLTQL